MIKMNSFQINYITHPVLFLAKATFGLPVLIMSYFGLPILSVQGVAACIFV